ncbi:cobalamin-dependent protein [uncultured Roseobacter sp.]|uniref:cobalamin B12-binding domain-containing protein n=1 Tax=uncultured Roseobacter sp. TaxID=114847 RepID=UPI0026241886|nr:cobalamin-dependent protein [uncultured Roseobacter sp.]
MDALATRVISVLRDRQVGTSDGVRRFVVDHLVRAILARGKFDPILVLDEMRGHRLTLDDVIDQYIPRAATLLGEKWAADEISFADVTVGALRLQSLLSEAACQARTDLPTDETRPSTMVVLPQGEQHFLGLSVVAAQLRRIGCDVSVSYDETPGSLRARLKLDRPDLVLISCARREGLETVAETVQTIRTSAPAGTIIALGGAVLQDADALEERTGVDIVTRNAKDAVSQFSRSGRTPTRS